MIKEIVANIKTDDLEILFRMDSGYFDEKIIETIESLGCKYLIKAKSYSTLASQATNSSVVFVKGEEGRETTELFTKLDNWEKDRRFVVSRVLKPEKERAQISLLEGSEYEYFFFVTNTKLLSEKLYPMKNVAMLRTILKKPNTTWRWVIFYLNHFGQMKRCFK